MVTPVSTQNTYSVILADLIGAQNKELTAQQQVSTGKKGSDLQAFGDQTRSLVATNTVKARVDGMVSQLNNLQVKMNFQQAALGQVSDVAANLKQSLTDAIASGQGDGVMSDVQSFFSQAAQALNTQYGGDYLFSGGQTQTQPFTAATLSQMAATPPAANPTVASFFQNGNLTPTNRIDDATTIQTGFLATDVGKQLMQVFQDIQSFQVGTTGNFGGQLTTAQQTFLQNELATLNGVVSLHHPDHGARRRHPEAHRDRGHRPDRPPDHAEERAGRHHRREHGPGRHRPVPGPERRAGFPPRCSWRSRACLCSTI
ncbi:MAG: flagellin [Caulobacteraceae bacterium]